MPRAEGVLDLQPLSSCTLHAGVSQSAGQCLSLSVWSISDLGVGPKPDTIIGQQAGVGTDEEPQDHTDEHANKNLCIELHVDTPARH